eukprot:TRINITY_DN1912_c0_g1_i1.p1 TRINITY_DN1912_c0_g1~~TRINITY_DN1912_c0_g1_i1.p1  ORF type:complete len:498 (+),score=125.56 TRINITY_DN1912_c0_g1_i1:41-1534(+)
MTAVRHIVALVASLCVAAASGTALDDYVWTPDPHFSYFDTNYTVKLPLATSYLLNVTTQKWLTENDSNRAIWSHQVMVTIPDVLKTHDHALMYITGGDNGDSPPDEKSEDLLLSYALSLGSGCIAVTLFQIPNQPVYFTADPKHKRRSEDAVIAFTWDRFINDTSNPEWLLRFPMTKSAVRVMDAVTDWVARKHPAVHLDNWLVAGASKRGWTTWTVGAVDSTRVKAIVPIVLDAANLHLNLHHMYRCYAGWTWALEDYYEQNITGKFDTDGFRQLCALVDPYAYFERYTNIAKLVISSSDDEFLMADDDHYWWDQLPGEKFRLFAQNTEHSMVTGIPEVLAAINAFAASVIHGAARPEFTWVIDQQGAIVVTEVKGQATRAVLRYAETIVPKRRDFRWLVGTNGPNNTCEHGTVSVKGKCFVPILWHSETLQPVQPGLWRAYRPPPPTGFGAFFVEMYYLSPVTGDEYRFTTQVSVLPDVFPYPDCEGEACRGVLV